MANRFLSGIKSWLNWSETLNPSDYRVDDTGKFFYFWSSNDYEFQQIDLRKTVELFYNNNPIGYSVINKITLAQKELKFIPYLNGEPIEGEKIDLDLYTALFNLITTGTVIIRPVAPVGFEDEPEYKILNTIDFVEIPKARGGTKYMYKNVDVTNQIDSFIFIRLFNPVNDDSVLGLSPFQASLMPLTTVREMYTADASLLKNKGGDVMLTNDSDEPMQGMDSDEMDKEINRRLKGARNHGKLATSTAKLRALNLGRTTKDLALWDGYKFKLRDICNVLAIDSSHFNDPDNKKFSNVGEAKKSLYTNAVIPYTKIITENKDLIDLLGYEIFIDSSEVEALQEDQKAKAEKNKLYTDNIIELNTQVRAGIITKDIAVNILVQEWDYDIEEAGKLINDIPVTENTQQNTNGNEQGVNQEA